MRCTHCGAYFQDDLMICPQCGTEVQIVPDYNPLEDVLAREVRDSVEDSSTGATRQIQREDLRARRLDSNSRHLDVTREIVEREDDHGHREPAQRQRVMSTKEKEEQRRRQQQKRLEAAKKKRRNLLIGLFLFLAFCILACVLAYQNSYSGMMKKGERALALQNYESAERYFNRAIVKDRSKAEAYIGLAQIYRKQDKLQQAEEVYLTVLESQPSNVSIYKAVIEFYEDTEQLEKISSLLEECKDETVLKEVGVYESKAPEFSLKEGTYEEVQEVSLTTNTGGTIYYTMDGSVPSQSSAKYSEPILLQEEGEILIRAISVNGKGVPSVISSAKYKIEFPIADAPAVSPSTGQYSEPVQITIYVPEGYTAYYTMDGSEPTLESSKYTGPIDMPQEKQTIFSAVLINDVNGKKTPVTKRTYFTISE